MAKTIKNQINQDSLDGIRHIDRPTWWLRKMVPADPGIRKEPKPEEPENLH